MMRHAALTLIALLSLGSPAGALVGGAEVVRGTGAGRHIVMIISTRGSLCTGTAIARYLVLTGGHCVAPAASYRVLLPDIKPPGLAIRSIAIHPRYNPKDYASGRVTADVALLKLEQPLPADVVPAAVAPVTSVAPGDRFVIAGYGGTSSGSEAGNGVARAAALIATGKPGTLQIRLFDPATRDQRPGLGACTGDSGGPAFVERNRSFAVVGVVSWSTGAASTAGCGGLTGVTPLAIYRGWIEEQAKKMGTTIGP
jgi:secreted trypsin-like serine protease